MVGFSFIIKYINKYKFLKYLGVDVEIKIFHSRNLQLAIHLLIWTLSNKIKVITYFI